MSSEGKKRRGISGASNGKSIPWRYGQHNACVPAGVPLAKKPAPMIPGGMSYSEATEKEFVSDRCGDTFAPPRWP